LDNSPRAHEVSSRRRRGTATGDDRQFFSRKDEQQHLVRHVVDRVDDEIVFWREASRRRSVSLKKLLFDGYATFGIDGAVRWHGLDLGAANGSVRAWSWRLMFGHANFIESYDVRAADAGRATALPPPGADAADADDANVRGAELLQPAGRRAGDAAESGFQNRSCE